MEGLGASDVDIFTQDQLFAGRSYRAPIAIWRRAVQFPRLDHWANSAISDLFSEFSQGYTDATGNHITAMTYYWRRAMFTSKQADPDTCRYGWVENSRAQLPHFT